MATLYPEQNTQKNLQLSFSGRLSIVELNEALYQAVLSAYRSGAKSLEIDFCKVYSPWIESLESIAQQLEKELVNMGVKKLVLQTREKEILVGTKESTKILRVAEPSERKWVA